LAAVWPILLGVAAARRSLSGALADLGGSLRLGTVRRFMAISLPSVMPAFIVGLRVAAPVTLVVTLLVELLTGVPGLGHLIALAQASFNAALTFGLVALAGVLGWLVNNLAAKAEHRLLRRHGLNRHADAAAM
jgi:ABC-type nitrate/sulfonate/bicarbonate transport system permease component